MQYVTDQDVAERLFRRKQHWFHGKPTIELTGINDSFGKLQFNFVDEIIEFSVYIKDREKILDAAYLAVENFSNIINRLWEES